MSKALILIVDDEADVRNLISDVLIDDGYTTLTAADETEALAHIKHSTPDLIFLDLWIKDDESGGIKILEKVKKLIPTVPVIMISGHGTVEAAVSAIKKGASDFIEKPFVIEKLLLTCNRALEILKLREENSILKSNKLDSQVYSIGNSSFASSISLNLNKIAATNSRVFLQGPTGLGIESMALAIHKKSPRAKAPFMMINCMSDDPHELDQEIFGTEKSYGLIERTGGGTLFFEDITKLNKAIQRKLLQLLQDGKYSLVNRIVYLDARIITSSTASNIDELCKEDKFSNELFYRLNIVKIEVPPIKERKEDIVPILDYYLSKSEQFFGLQPRKFSPEAIAVLQSYDWPGNIRQIKNAVESSLINALDDKDNQISLSCLPKEITASTKEKLDSLNIAKFISLPIKEAKGYFESDYLIAQINRFSGNISQTANFIGMERSALHRKLKTLHINCGKRVKNNG